MYIHTHIHVIHIIHHTSYRAGRHHNLAVRWAPAGSGECGRRRDYPTGSSAFSLVMVELCFFTTCVVFLFVRGVLGEWPLRGSPAPILRGDTFLPASSNARLSQLLPPSRALARAAGAEVARLLKRHVWRLLGLAIRDPSSSGRPTRARAPGRNNNSSNNN